MWLSAEQLKHKQQFPLILYYTTPPLLNTSWPCRIPESFRMPTFMKDLSRTSVSSVSCLCLFPLVSQSHLLNMFFLLPASKIYSLPEQHVGIVLLSDSQFCFAFTAWFNCFVSMCFFYTPTKIQLCTHVNTVKGKLLMKCTLGSQKICSPQGNHSLFHRMCLT